jgi:dTDP-4-dehydrorhamnose reductase
MKVPAENSSPTTALRYLITGGAGFFGMNAARWLRERGHGVMLTSSVPERYGAAGAQFLPMNICDAEAVQRSLDAVCKNTNLDAIIHAAAFSQPLACEQDTERAWAVNVRGTKNVLQAASNLDVPFVFLSTDLVFDGEHSPEELYREDDTPNTRIVYGQTKIAAERLIAEQSFGKWLIVRSALMFGAGTPWSNGFPQFAVEALQNGKPTTLFTDQFRTPIWTDDLACAVHALLAGKCFQTTLHASGAERINRVDFVRRYCALAGVDTSGIHAVPMDAVPSYTTRVRDVALDSSRLCGLVGWQPTPLDRALAAIIGLEKI